MFLNITVIVIVSIISFLLGVVMSVICSWVATPFVGSLWYEDTEGKDIYSIILNQDLNDFDFKDGQYLMLKFRKKNTHSNGKTGQKEERNE